MFHSTRDSSVAKEASLAILDGLAPDGGLYVPEKIPSLNAKDLSSLTYAEMAEKVLSLYLDDFSEEELKEATSLAYDKNHFAEKILDVKSFSSLSFLELFHGATLTFKDMALSLLPYLMSYSAKKHPERPSIKILTATSGDTGSAVLSAFSRRKDIQVSILYPEGGIAPIQEKQMLYFTSSTSRAYALEESNFDTCQSLVKELLLKGEKQGYTSANSINIGRLLPQITYYYWAYLTMVERGEITYGDKIDVIVPTGNFGDILAGYFAKKMSLPIDKLILASNRNRILTDFFKTGVYDLNRPFYKTESPSMDILISSNLERLLFFVSQDEKKVASWMKDLKEKKRFEVDENMLASLREDFEAYSADDEKTEEAIRNCYKENGYLLDPHTAVAYSAYQQRKNQGKKTLIVETASPLKFPETVLHALEIPAVKDKKPLDLLVEKTGIEVPSALKEVLDNKTEPFLLKPEEVEGELFSKKTYVVSTPATSANLGPGFDSMGLALSLKNEFAFERDKDFSLIGFPDIAAEDNLVLKAYRYAFEKANEQPVPVCITETKQEIPVSGGLGSSASAIVAGLLGANELLHRKFTKDELYQMAAELEGHPDNVGPCLYGGYVINLKTEEGYKAYPQEVSSDLRFLLVIPNAHVSTEKARSVLPSSYKKEEVVKELSHAALLPTALKTGNLSLLKEVLPDYIHVPYRASLIPDYKAYEEAFEKFDIPFTISGSGSTLIGFYKEREDSIVDKMKSLLKDKEVVVLKAELCSLGASEKEERK